MGTDDFCARTLKPAHGGISIIRLNGRTAVRLDRILVSLQDLQLERVVGFISSFVLRTHWFTAIPSLQRLNIFRLRTVEPRNRIASEFVQTTWLARNGESIQALR